MSNEPNPGAIPGSPSLEGIAPAGGTPATSPAPITLPEAKPEVPVYLRIWRAIWGTNPTPTLDGSTPPTDGTREIVETIVFVVVLVLMLRCFVAEAFVIPTGSMAETLFGYQKMVTCPQCGWFFPVNCSGEVEAMQEGTTPRPTDRCVCPNCRLSIALTSPNRPYDPRENKGQPIPDPGFSTGDRVLVSKFLYDLLGRSPDRLDVVVFKFPGDGEKGYWPETGPQQRGVPMNYIKRLVGLPGETIYIYRGDLYRDAAVDLKRWEKEDFSDCPDEASKAARRLVLWREQYTHSEYFSPTQNRDAYQALIQQINKGDVHIIRKPAEKILSERRIVYHNDHQPADLQGSKAEPRWKPDGPGWTTQGTEFTSQSTEQTAWLRYRHLLRGDGNGPQSSTATYIGDFLGYNSDPWTNQNGAGRNWVRDLILECEVDVPTAEGKFALELSSGVDRFRAEWNLSDGYCTLFRIRPHGAGIAGNLGMEQIEQLDSRPTHLKKPGKYRVRLANVDRQLVVWVDGSLPFGSHGVGYEAPRDHEMKDYNDIKQPASIGVSGAALTVRNVGLWRDVFYTTGELGGSTEQIRRLYVQPGHFLCMGDNSPASSDGRKWGLVPARLMLGKAQVVYYPFYFPWWPMKAPVNRVGLIR